MNSTKGMQKLICVSFLFQKFGAPFLTDEYLKEKILTQFANTGAFSNLGGVVTLNVYSDTELKELTSITHGTQYTGNTDLDRVYTEHVYKNGPANRLNLVGQDGFLKLYNQSKFIPKEAETAVANFWNYVAGEEIVRFVNTVQESDEVIHDISGDNGVLAAQTYDGNGLVVYPDSWHIDDLSKEQQENWHLTTIIHEIGHGLGIPHLGGGVDGANAGKAGKFGNELMGPWSVFDNPDGAKSTLIEAAALAIAGLTWRNPRRLASWVLDDKNKKAYALYNKRVTTSTIPMSTFPSVLDVTALKDWGKAKLYTLDTDYFESKIYLTLQSGVVSLSLAGYMTKDVLNGDFVIANTKSIKSFPLPLAITRGFIVDVTRPESKNGVIGVLRWYPNGNIVVNFNASFKASENRHYFDAGLTAVTNLNPNF